MTKLEYKPAVMQDECFNSKYNDDVTVFVKLEANTKKGKRHKVIAQSFKNATELDNYIKNNDIKVLPEKEFRAYS